MTYSLVWPDLSSTQGVITFSISAHATEGLVQFTGQNGPVTPQKSWGDNQQYNIIYVQTTCDKMSTRG